jgi:biotin operon repressor
VGWRRIYLFAFTGATPSVEELRQPLSYSRFALWKDATAVAAISTLNIG